MKTEQITVRTQANMGAIPPSFVGDIVIDIPYGYPGITVSHFYGGASIIVKGTSEVIFEGSGGHDNYATDYSYVVLKNSTMLIAQRNARVKALKESKVLASDNSIVSAHDLSTVKARGRSLIYAYERAKVSAYDKAHVYANENTYITAYGSTTIEGTALSKIEAKDQSVVNAYEGCAVTASDFASVAAYDDSFVTAYDSVNVMIKNNAKAELFSFAHATIFGPFGNAKLMSKTASVICPNESVETFSDYHGIRVEGDYSYWYKAVRILDGKYCSKYDTEFEYHLGKEACIEDLSMFDDDPNDSCGYGLHVSTLKFAKEFAGLIPVYAILECKVKSSDIVIPYRSTGKVRVPRLTVVREVEKGHSDVVFF